MRELSYSWHGYTEGVATRDMMQHAVQGVYNVSQSVTVRMIPSIMFFCFLQGRMTGI